MASNTIFVLRVECIDAFLPVFEVNRFETPDTVKSKIKSLTIR